MKNLIMATVALAVLLAGCTGGDGGESTTGGDSSNGTVADAGGNGAGEVNGQVTAVDDNSTSTNSTMATNGTASG